MSLPKKPQAFAEFLKLLNHCYQLSDEQLNDIQHTYEENEYDKFYHLFNLLAEKFDYYFDDSNFSSEDLCGYISKHINQEFFVRDEDVLADIEVVITCLESETEYSLFGLDIGNYCLNIWVIKKSDRPTLLELAKNLGLLAY